MKQLGNMKLYSFEEIEDKIVGEPGSPRRDAYEARLQEELHAHHIGEVIRQARIEKKLTQEQLGELMGVKRTQVSKMENGKNLSFSIVSRAFKAMNIPANLVLGRFSFALW